MAELKPCPFCGNTKLTVNRKSKVTRVNDFDWRVEYRTFSVRCNVCHARGGTASGKVIPRYNYFISANERLEIPKWATLDDELKTRAIDLWNRRVGEDGN